jgi:hypothetical protein
MLTGLCRPHYGFCSWPLVHFYTRKAAGDKSLSLHTTDNWLIKLMTVIASMEVRFK